VYGVHLKLKLSLLLNIPLIILFSGGALILGLREMYFYLFCYSFFFLNVILIANAFLEGFLLRVLNFEKKHNEQLDHLGLTAQMLIEEMDKIKINAFSKSQTTSLDKAYIITKNLLLTNLESIEDKSFDLRSQLALATQSQQNVAFIRFSNLTDNLKNQTERLRKEFCSSRFSPPAQESLTTLRPPLFKKVMSSAVKKSA
jgi:hypothetical protein